MKEIVIAKLNEIEYTKDTFDNKDIIIYHYDELKANVDEDGVHSAGVYYQRMIADSVESFMDQLFNHYYLNSNASSFRLYDKKEVLMRMFEKDHQ